MGNGKQTISLQLFWMPNGCKAHSRVLMEWDQNILQRILHAAVKWECMIVQYIACNPSVAIPGPFYIPQQCGIHIFTFIGFESTLILTDEVREERKPSIFII